VNEMNLWATTGVLLLAIQLGGCSSKNDGPPASSSSATTPAVPPRVAQPIPPPPPSEPRSGEYNYVGVVQSFWLGDVGLRPPSNCHAPDASSALCVDAVLADGEAQDLNSIDRKVIELRATVAKGVNTATVEVLRAVVGPVEAIDADHARITVMGQDVFLWGVQGRVDALALIVGAVAEVNGYVGAGGQIFATRIDRAPAGAPFLVRGILTAGPHGILRVGALEVDLASANLVGFPASTPLPQDPVVLIAATAPRQGILAVDKARFERAVWDATSMYQGHRLLLQGVVTAVRSPFDFDVGGRKVIVESCTCYQFTALPPAVGTPLDLRTSDYSGGSTLISTNIGPWSTVQMRGQIEQVDPAQRRLRLLGFDVQGFPVTYVGARDSENIAGDQLSFAYLDVGDVVKVTAQTFGSMLVASSIVRNEGHARIVTDLFKQEFPNLRLLNQLVATDQQTSVQCAQCADSGQSAAFPKDQYFPPLLTIDLDSEHPPLRAASIIVDLQ